MRRTERIAKCHGRMTPVSRILFNSKNESRLCRVLEVANGSRERVSPNNLQFSRGARPPRVRWRAPASGRAGTSFEPQRHRGTEKGQAAKSVSLSCSVPLWFSLGSPGLFRSRLLWFCLAAQQLLQLGQNAQFNGPMLQVCRIQLFPLHSHDAGGVA